MTETIERMIERIKAERDADAARIAELESALAAATDPQTIDRTTESAIAAMRASLARLVEEAAAARAEADALRREAVAARPASAPQRAVRCLCGQPVQCPCGLRLVEDAPTPALEPPDHLAGVEVWP